MMGRGVGFLRLNVTYPGFRFALYGASKGFISYQSLNVTL